MDSIIKLFNLPIKTPSLQIPLPTLLLRTLVHDKVGPPPPGVVEPPKVNQLSNKCKQEYFATPRVGGYYFIPSINTVKSWGAAAQGSGGGNGGGGSGGGPKPFQGQHTIAGTHRVKVYNTGTNRYWNYLRPIQVFPLLLIHLISQWNITSVPGVPNVFTIRPVSETSIGFDSPNDTGGKCWGYGPPEERVGSDQ